MKTLIVWDDPNEADLLGIYLQSDENTVRICLERGEGIEQASSERWDALLMPLAYPTPEEGLKLFEEMQQLMPATPIVLACRQREMISLPRFLTRGLRFYVVRDEQGDYHFLLLTSIESAVEAGKAEETRKLAERLREEMDSVRRLQQSIIPRGLDAPPGYRTAARYEPSQVNVIGGTPVVMAGGDYYDLFRTDEKSMIALIGDASGHGLKACMSIMAMHTLIRMFTGSRYRDTAPFVAEINERLCENSIVQSDGGFITLFYATLDTQSHQLTWTSAGHPNALLHNLELNEITQAGADKDCGFPLGIAPGAPYESFTLAIPPASRVVIFSDGLTDAMPLDASGGRKMFGLEGIRETLRACRTASLDDTLEQLFRASHEFTSNAGRHDDTSVMLLERVAV